MRGKRARIWPGVRGGIAVTGVVVVMVALVGCGGSGGSPHGQNSPGSSPSNGASTASACVLSGGSAAGSGPWKVVEPRTLCGLPVDNSPVSTEAEQQSLTATELVFSPVGGQANPGTETSAFSVGYQIPSSANFDRFINVVAFNGTFNMQAAVSALAQLDTNPDIPGNVFKSVPPGPHGGLMECAPSYSAEECVFGTSTTLGQFEIDDTLHELTGASTATNAVRIRDALEVPA
jgi:hypothetical protein